MLYQFYRAKYLKLEAKLRHREKELSAAEVEIEELKKSLKEKEKLGEAEADLRSELIAVCAELEQTRGQVSAFTGLVLFPLLPSQCVVIPLYYLVVLSESPHPISSGWRPRADMASERKGTTEIPYCRVGG